jgi:hypothetical protein
MHRILKNAILTCAAAGVLAGCATETVNTRLLGPGGEADDIWAVTLGSPAGFPAGSYMVASPNDLWIRAGGLTQFFNNQNLFEWLTYTLHPAVRNASEDPRLPALDASISPEAGRFFVLFAPRAFGVTAHGWWNLYGEIEGLKPNTVYTAMMVRYGLTVNGTLDAERVLRGLAPDAPDQLTAIGGAPGGAPLNQCDFSAVTAVEPDANPFVLGWFETNANGRGTIDCLISAHGGGGWWRNAATFFPAGALDSLPIWRNLYESFELPTYNYVVLVEGMGTGEAPVPEGPHAVRMQVAQDLTLAGQPLRNAFAPFPLETQTAILARLEFRNASQLQAGSAYHFWAVDTVSGAFTPVAGNWYLINEALVVVDSALNVSSIHGGGEIGFVNRFEVTTATFTGALVDYNQILVTIDAAGATQPTGVVFMSAVFQPVPAIPDAALTGTLRFSNQPTFAFTGAGVAHFFGDELRVLVNNLRVPPRGYFYEVFLVNESTGAARSLGPLTDSQGNSLRDADVNLSAGTFIGSAMLVVDQSQQADLYWGDYTAVYVTLSSKAGTGIQLPIVLQGAIHDEVIAANQRP